MKRPRAPQPLAVSTALSVAVDAAALATRSARLVARRTALLDIGLARLAEEGKFIGPDRLEHDERDRELAGRRIVAAASRPERQVGRTADHPHSICHSPCPRPARAVCASA